MDPQPFTTHTKDEVTIKNDKTHTHTYKTEWADAKNRGITKPRSGGNRTETDKHFL